MRRKQWKYPSLQHIIPGDSVIWFPFKIYEEFLILYEFNNHDYGTCETALCIKILVIHVWQDEFGPWEHVQNAPCGGKTVILALPKQDGELGLENHLGATDQRACDMLHSDRNKKTIWSTKLKEGEIHIIVHWPSHTLWDMCIFLEQLYTHSLLGKQEI